MEHQLALALQENDRLRSLLKRDTITLAHADAMALALRHFSAYPISRRKAAKYGITHRRWEWAMALLNAARVYTHRRGWTVNDINLVALALERAAKSTPLASLEMRRRSQQRRTPHKRRTPGEGFD